MRGVTTTLMSWVFDVCVCVCERERERERERLWTGELGTEGEWAVCICRGPSSGSPWAPERRETVKGNGREGKVSGRQWT